MDTDNPLRAMGCSTLLAAGLVTAAFPVFFWFFFPLIFLLTGLAAAIVGLPLYLAARAAGQVNAWTAAAGGALAGAAIPLIFLTGDSTATTELWLFPILALGIGGAGMGLVFLLILRWETLAPKVRTRFAVLASLPIAAILCVAVVSSNQPVRQRESQNTVAAFDVPLPTATDREQFLGVLRREAAAAGFHFDAVSDQDLRIMSQVSPLTMNASISRRENGFEFVASAMNPPTEPGRIWITFAKGEDPQRSAAFRQRLMRVIIQRWPETLSLPIMPTGAIPNPEDLLRTRSGYVIKPSEEFRYQLPKEPPAAPR